MHWVYLGFAIFAEVIATSALKAAAGFTRLGPTAIVVLGYTLAFYFLSLALHRIPLGIAYAVWSGVGLLLISLTGWIVYRQNLDLPAVLGMVLIMLGILVIKMFSRVSTG
jgi:small multidrug resistance pump